MSEGLRQKGDFRIAFVLGAAYLVALSSTAHGLGYARDEGFYFEAARAYQGWFDLLWSDPAAAFQRASVDRYWAVNHEHPSLMKVLFSFSHQLFHDKLRFIPESGTAYRLPGMAMGALCVSVLYLWGSRVLGRAPGVFAAVAFALLPRVFYHAHLACFDVPVTTMWLVASYAYFRALQSGRRRWVWGSGLLYGLLLETKHNAWILPIALGVHLLVIYGAELLAHQRLPRPVVPRPLWAMAILGPVVFLALWPWMWFEPWQRFPDYVRFHTQHEYYNMEFLGQTYWKPPMPEGYAWLMTVATVPLVTLLLGIVGGFAALVLVREGPEPATNAKHAVVLKPLLSSPSSAQFFWLVALLVSYAPWWSSKTPIFGGTKHWMTAYPFLCLLAAKGFSMLCAQLREWAAERKLSERAIVPATFALLSVAPLVMTIHSHPFALSFYTPVVGGAAGAATRGLNRTFWGYTTGSLADFLNERAAPDASVFVHDTALQSWEMLREDGRIRSDLRGTLAIHQSSLALYHHEQHMAAVEYQIWVDYDTVVPARIETYDGVPVVWVYERAHP
jgi:4-amino-4-deoxy-L-arabinose transferase-like glycosyltransferase